MDSQSFPHKYPFLHALKKMPLSGSSTMDYISVGRVLRRAFNFAPCTDKLNRRHFTLPVFHLRENLIRSSSGFDQRRSSESLTGQKELDCQTETSVPKIKHEPKPRQQCWLRQGLVWGSRYFKQRGLMEAIRNSSNCLSGNIAIC